MTSAQLPLSSSCRGFLTLPGNVWDHLYHTSLADGCRGSLEFRPVLRSHLFVRGHQVRSYRAAPVSLAQALYRDYQVLIEEILHLLCVRL